VIRTDFSAFYTGCIVATRSTARRKDARRNREAILSAAREMFAESGDVAMYEVARRAEVGQATLYRNFADRETLIAALAEDSIEELERVSAEHAADPDGLFVLLQAMVESAVRFYGLFDCAQQAAAGAGELEPLQKRLTTLIQRPLRKAKSARLVRRDLSVEDVFLLIGMVEGAVRRERNSADRAAAAARVLQIALDGLMTRP
jgi:AcrR family transcriptional regulator